MDIQSIVERYAAHTDDPKGIHLVMERFLEALSRSDGEAALEVGVRAGGTSAMMCEIARRSGLAGPQFRVLSVDPYGECPYIEGGKDVSSRLDYGEHFYVQAKTLLAPFANSILFRMDADSFLRSVLPSYAWWFEHKRFPSRRPFLSFAYLDGPHDSADVASQALMLWDLVVAGGEICIDNGDHCPAAQRFLAQALPGAQVERFPHHRVAITKA